MTVESLDDVVVVSSSPRPLASAWQQQQQAADAMPVQLPTVEQQEHQPLPNHAAADGTAMAAAISAAAAAAVPRVAAASRPPWGVSSDCGAAMEHELSCAAPNRSANSFPVRSTPIEMLAAQQLAAAAAVETAAAIAVGQQTADDGLLPTSGDAAAAAALKEGEPEEKEEDESHAGSTSGLAVDAGAARAAVAGTARAFMLRSGPPPQPLESEAGSTVGGASGGGDRSSAGAAEGDAGLAVGGERDEVSNGASRRADVEDVCAATVSSTAVGDAADSPCAASPSAAGDTVSQAGAQGLEEVEAASSLMTAFGGPESEGSAETGGGAAVVFAPGATAATVAAVQLAQRRPRSNDEVLRLINSESRKKVRMDSPMAAVEMDAAAAEAMQLVPVAGARRYDQEVLVQAEPLGGDSAGAHSLLDLGAGPLAGSCWQAEAVAEYEEQQQVQLAAVLEAGAAECVALEDVSRASVLALEGASEEQLLHAAAYDVPEVMYLRDTAEAAAPGVAAEDSCGSSEPTAALEEEGQEAAGCDACSLHSAAEHFPDGSAAPCVSGRASPQRRPSAGGASVCGDSGMLSTRPTLSLVGDGESEAGNLSSAWPTMGGAGASDAGARALGTNGGSDDASDIEGGMSYGQARAHSSSTQGGSSNAEAAVEDDVPHWGVRRQSHASDGGFVVYNNMEAIQTSGGGGSAGGTEDGMWSSAGGAFSGRCAVTGDPADEPSAMAAGAEAEEEGLRPETGSTAGAGAEASTVTHAEAEEAEESVLAETEAAKASADAGAGLEAGGDLEVEVGAVAEAEVHEVHDGPRAEALLGAEDEDVSEEAVEAANKQIDEEAKVEASAETGGQAGAEAGAEALVPGIVQEPSEVMQPEVASPKHRLIKSVWSSSGGGSRASSIRSVWSDKSAASSSKVTTTVRTGSSCIPSPQSGSTGYSSPSGSMRGRSKIPQLAAAAAAATAASLGGARLEADRSAMQPAVRDLPRSRGASPGAGLGKEAQPPRPMSARASGVVKSVAKSALGTSASAQRQGRAGRSAATTAAAANSPRALGAAASPRMSARSTLSGAGAAAESAAATAAAAAGQPARVTASPGRPRTARYLQTTAAAAAKRVTLSPRATATPASTVPSSPSLTPRGAVASHSPAVSPRPPAHPSSSAPNPSAAAARALAAAGVAAKVSAAQASPRSLDPSPRLPVPPVMAMARTKPVWGMSSPKQTVWNAGRGPAKQTSPLGQGATARRTADEVAGAARD